MHYFRWLKFCIYQDALSFVWARWYVNYSLRVCSTRTPLTTFQRLNVGENQIILSSYSSISFEFFSLWNVYREIFAALINIWVSMNIEFIWFRCYFNKNTKKWWKIIEGLSLDLLMRNASMKGLRDWKNVNQKELFNPCEIQYFLF